MYVYIHNIKRAKVYSKLADPIRLNDFLFLGGHDFHNSEIFSLLFKTIYQCFRAKSTYAEQIAYTVAFEREI